MTIVRTLSQSPKKCLLRPIFSFIASSACCYAAIAEVEFVQVGDPPWKLTGGFVTAIPVEHHPGNTFGQDFFTFMANAFDGAHVSYSDRLELLPGDPHDGPFDREYREAMARAGGFESDVFLAADLRTPKRLLQAVTILPLEGNIPGLSVRNIIEPIIPKDVFPINWTVRAWVDGDRVNICDGCVATVEDLNVIGQITDDDGNQRDYSGLGRNHIHRGWTVHRNPNLSSDIIAGDYEGRLEFRDNNGDGWDAFYSYEVVPHDTNVAGDLNYNEQLDENDLQILIANLGVGSKSTRLDLDEDDVVDTRDFHHWISELMDTWIGDANLDGQFNSGDLVDVFTAGKYETDELARWSEGDWNADERFDSSDFVAAFQGGGYERGLRNTVANVPEPAGLTLIAIGVVGILRCRFRSLAWNARPLAAKQLLAYYHQPCDYMQN